MYVSLFVLFWWNVLIAHKIHTKIVCLDVSRTVHLRFPLKVPTYCLFIYLYILYICLSVSQSLSIMCDWVFACLR